MSCSSCQQNNHISNSTTEDSLCECACGCAEPTCPTPQPCTEITDARCIIYTQAAIKCGNDTVVTTNASASTALTQIVTYFCNKISESLIPDDIICNEDIIVNAGATVQDAIVDIISYFCDKFNNTIEGSGLNNYLARWTPDGNTLGYGLIQDNGTRLGIGIAPQVNFFLVITSTINETTFKSINLFAGSGSGHGVIGYAQGACLGNNYGVHGSAQGALNSNVGGWFVASGNNPCSVRLSDGTQGVGKFLKSIDNIGSANWANITAADVSGVVAGSGALNYVAKWTPNGTTLGNSLIQDNGTNLSVGTSINTGAKLIIVGNGVGAGAIIDVVSAMNTTSGLTSNAVSGLNGSSNGINTGGFNVGVTGTSSANTASNIGVSGSTAGASVTNIGGKFTATGASNNYSIQLQDGTHTVAGRFLKNITTDGKANWANITVSDVTNAVGSTTGTNNYVAKFTPNGTTIGNSLIQDNGTAVGVNMAPNANAMLYVTGGSQTNTIAAQSNVNNGTAIYGQAFTGTGTLIGVSGFANSATSTNNIGLYGKAISGASNYPIQLEESTSSTGKFLKSITSDGKANWATITTADVENLQKEITTTYTLTDVDDNYTIFINNGATPITISLGAITKANFCVGFIQEGSADVTFVGVTNPVGLKLKGQGYQAFIERKLSTATYYLLGNTKV